MVGSKEPVSTAGPHWIADCRHKGLQIITKHYKKVKNGRECALVALRVMASVRLLSTPPDMSRTRGAFSSVLQISYELGHISDIAGKEMSEVY